MPNVWVWRLYVAWLSFLAIVWGAGSVYADGVAFRAVSVALCAALAFMAGAVATLATRG